MTILVTGAAGFLGAATVDRLLAHGHSRIRFFLKPSTDRSRLDAVIKKYPGAELEYAFGNLTSRKDTLAATEGISMVYHLAAALRGAPADIYYNTLVGSSSLIEAMRVNRPDRVLLVSSFGVYGFATIPRSSLVDENTPLESAPARRDHYSAAKLRQEQLFREYQRESGTELTVLRPGVIYGPGGSPLSTRIGLSVSGLLFHIGGRNLLPLSYVENCAEAIAVAGDHPEAANQVYNVHDDDLPTCAGYLTQYKRAAPVRSVRVPYPAALLLSSMIERYSKYSGGQLPPVLTPYKTAALWKGWKFTNRKLKSIGWRPIVPTAEALRLTFRSVCATKPCS